MSKQMIKVVLWMVFACMGCNVTEVGNPNINPNVPVNAARMSLLASSSNASVASIQGGGAKVQINHVWLVIDEVRFVRNADCASGGTGGEVDIKDIHIIDVVNNSAGVVQLPFGSDTYCRLEVRLGRAQTVPANAPTELLDHSIVIEGVRSDGVSFVLSSRDQKEIEIRSSGAPFAFDAAKNALLLVFDVATWFQNIDLDIAEIGYGGVIVVDDSVNKALLDLFKNNLDQALKLYSDDKLDGRFDTESGSVPLAEGV